MRRSTPKSSFPIRKKMGGRKGFTLLEIIVTLAIMAIIGTMFALRFVDEGAGEELRKPAGELRKMAMTANRQAAAYRNEYRITFFPDGFFLSQAPITDRRNAGEIAFDHYVISGSRPMVLEIRRLGNPKWQSPNGAVWLFQPAGLCEPIEVRLSNDRGFLEMTFNPMTATVDDERFVFQ